MSEPTPIQQQGVQYHIEFLFDPRNRCIVHADDTQKLPEPIQKEVVEWIALLAQGRHNQHKRDFVHEKSVIVEFMEVEVFPFRAERCSATVTLPGGDKEDVHFWLAVCDRKNIQVVGNRADPRNGWRPIPWNPKSGITVPAAKVVEA